MDKDLFNLLDKIGEHLDKGEKDRHWTPEANLYSRAFNTKVLLDLVANHLKQSDLYLLFSFVNTMDSENKIGCKYLSKLNIPRTNKYRSINRLLEKGVIFIFPDGSIMVNPKLVVLSKYRKNILSLLKVWSKALENSIAYNQEIEQEEQLF